MKSFIPLLLAYFALTYSFAQSSELPYVAINENVSTHFVSKLNIDYTDLSTNNVVGDLPLKNILRIKPKTASDNLGIATVVGESFFLQFRLIYSPEVDRADTHINLDDPTTFKYPTKKMSNTNEVKDEVVPVNNYKNPNYSLSHSQLEKYANVLKKEKPNLNNVVSKKYQMKLKVNNIWVVEDYIYFDYTATNKTNIPYTIDEIRYKIIDTKQLKATNSQDRLIEPDYVSNKETFVDKKFRNIAAFKKFTFPNDKSFIIEMAEDQISGRTITLEMSYSDILSASVLNRKIENAR